MGAATQHNSLLGKGEDSLDLSNKSRICGYFGPYRTAPKKDNPDMYEIRSENPDAPLAPGRYALVLKGLAYDFSVAGPVTDPRQCLERLVANNGRFYSEYRKK